MEPSTPAATGDLELVLHRVAGERGVVGLDVQLEVLQQAVFARGS
jgi:hypothetical protein